MMSPLVAAARSLAERAHATQRRKALNQPYISHLEAVAELLRTHGHDDELTIAAAYLHDVLEDQPAFAAELIATMPNEVADTVRALSEPKQRGDGSPMPKSERFAAYLSGLSVDADAVRRALPVSCADKIHNTLSLIEAEAGGDPILMKLTTRPGEHRSQLARLRPLYAPRVTPSLLAAYDDAARGFEQLLARWLPGRAALIAAEAHLGQLDEAGAPYIYHPMQLAMATADHDERTVALLHDVVEDTSWTLDALAREGYGEPILRALDALTRRSDERYEDFIARIAHDRLATRVKLLDLAHNSDLSRLPGPPSEADLARLERYRAATVTLQQASQARSLYVRLDAESCARVRAHARLEVARGEHVTLAYRVQPSQLDPSWIPGGYAVGSAVELRVVAERANERVQAFVVELAGSRVRPIDGAVLHVTVSRSAPARSRDANALLAGGVDVPVAPELVLAGVIEWADE
jgi:hypothetical protein